MRPYQVVSRRTLFPATTLSSDILIRASSRLVLSSIIVCYLPVQYTCHSRRIRCVPGTSILRLFAI